MGVSTRLLGGLPRREVTVNTVIRARIAEWWQLHSPYWKGYRAGLHAHQQARARYDRLERYARGDYQ